MNCHNLTSIQVCATEEQQSFQITLSTTSSTHLKPLESPTLKPEISPFLQPCSLINFPSVNYLKFTSSPRKNSQLPGASSAHCLASDSLCGTASASHGSLKYNYSSWTQKSDISLGKHQLWRHRRKWEYHIKHMFRNIRNDVERWLEPAHNYPQWRLRWTYYWRRDFGTLHSKFHGSFFLRS
jgi:hypothetical protein